MPKSSRAVSSSIASGLRGTSALVIQAVKGITDLVEDMHRNIASVSPVVGIAKQGRTKGITGLVYRSVRGVTDVVGWGLDKSLGLADHSLTSMPAVAAVAASALKPLATRLNLKSAQPYRETVLAAANGVLGDTMAATSNPLAIRMQLRQQGAALTLTKAALKTQIQQPTSKVLVLVHGLCMNDLQWLHVKDGVGHDHGAALAQDLGYTPVYLHYNSGRHISESGRDLANILQSLTEAWPVAMTELVIIGHSMGGLVSRSACEVARVTAMPWLKQLNKLICLGTPHHGAPLERAGSWLDYLLGISPYTAPFAKLGLVRSAGIKDLRHGNMLDSDWQGRSTSRAHDRGGVVALPKGVKCYVVAASKKAQLVTAQSAKAQPAMAQSDVKVSSRNTTNIATGKILSGDGLVPVRSALGQHEDVGRALSFPASHQYIAYSTDHFQLLSNPAVYRQLEAWLAKP